MEQRLKEGRHLHYFGDGRLEATSGVKDIIEAVIGMWGYRYVGQYSIIKPSSNNDLPHHYLSECEGIYKLQLTH